MKAKQNSQSRLLLPTMPLLSKLPPPKSGELAQVARTGQPVEEVILTGVLKVVILIGPPLPLPLPLPPLRTPKNLPSGLIAVLGTAKRKSPTTR